MKDVIILGAGVGSRLRPLTDSLPKLLVPVSGRTILERALEGILAADPAASITIVVGYRAQDVRAFVRARYPQVRVVENHSYDISNNMHSLYLAMAMLTLANDLVVMNGDCVYDPGVLELALRARRNAIVVDPHYPVNAESMKVRGEAGRATAIAKTITADEGGIVSVDLYAFTAQASRDLYKIIDRFEIEADRNKWTEVALDELLAATAETADAFETLPLTGQMWMEIDNMDDLADAEKRFPG